MKTVTLPLETVETFIAAAESLKLDLAEWLSELGSEDSDCDKNNRDDLTAFDRANADLKRRLRCTS